MKGDHLPADNHISRYCKFTTLSEETGQPLGTAFMPRPNKDKFLSVNWLEYFGDIGIEAQLTEIRTHINLKIKKSGRFSVLEVGNTLEYVNKNNDKEICITHEPSNGDPSHSGIRGYSHEDEMVGDLIAETVNSVHPAIPAIVP